MAVLYREDASLVPVHMSAGAKPLKFDEASQRVLAMDLTDKAATPHTSSVEIDAADPLYDSQRSSGRSRTPTQRLAESNLNDSTRLIFLSGGTRDHGSASTATQDGEAGGSRRGRRQRSADGQGPRGEQREGRSSQTAGERPGKRRRGELAGDDGAGSRPKRVAAMLGEVKREICMEKLFVRRAGKGGSSGKLSSGRPMRSGSGDAAGVRRQERQASQSEGSERRGRRGAERGGKVLNGRLRKLPVVKAASGSKTRLDLGSNAASSNGASAGKASVPGKSAVGLDDADDASTGSSEQGTHRRDWGLMEVDAVGRNRPPFARTMLYHGTVPFPLPADLSDQAAARNWVIKRWPEKTNRRKIDQEVHECIKAHPHPYLVRIVDVSPSEGVLMDYWNEGDLHKHMTTARRKFMPVKEIARYMVQLLRGLAHLHKHKVVHCDVSPQNVFLRRDREREEQLKVEEIDSSSQTVCYTCALGDFGHSYILSQHEESRSGVAHQGAGFVAPEVKKGRVSTMASDIYSAGKILDELLNLSESFGEAFAKEPRFMVRKLRGLAQSMCCPTPSERPTALRACQKLDTLGESIN